MAGRVSRWHRPGAGIRVFLGLLLLFSQGTVRGDNLADAYTLLRTTEVAREFELAARHQAGNVIRTFSSIVATSTDYELPDSLQQEMLLCYEEAFAWHRFEPGIAMIFAQTLSAEELGLLIDFFNDKSVPPPMIETFRAVISRAEEIERLAMDYLVKQSADCEQANVALILKFLSDQGS